MMKLITSDREVQAIVPTPDSQASRNGEDLLFPACSSACVETIRATLESEITAGNDLFGPRRFSRDELIVVMSDVYEKLFTRQKDLENETTKTRKKVMIELATQSSTSQTAELAALRSCLAEKSEGIIEETAELERLLASCWVAFIGSHEQGMVGDKLRNRMKNVLWQSPHLWFEIERHGKTKCGSIYATVHSWHIDLSNTTAGIVDSHDRQVCEREPDLDTGKIAASVDLAIRKHRSSPWLQWNPDGSVKVLIKKIIPQHTVKLTIETRTRRFKTQLAKLLAKHGWEMVHKLQSARCEFRLISPTVNPPD